MKEFLMLIRTEGDYCGDIPADQYKEHIQRVSNYIQKLSLEGRLKSAQPLTMNGTMLQGVKGVFKNGPFIESKEVIGGYFLILAADMEEALEIARANPVFEETDARIEIREIKHEEGIN